MSPLCLLWMIFAAHVLVDFGNSAFLRENMPDRIHGRYKRASQPECVDKPDNRGQITLYHYTDKNGFDGIKSSGKILVAASVAPRDDARYGPGVYFTSLGPETSDQNLASNNWNATVEEVNSKLKYYYVCRVDRDNICHSVHADDENRDIWIFTQGTFDINTAGTCSGSERALTSASNSRASSPSLSLSLSLMSVLFFSLLY